MTDPIVENVKAKFDARQQLGFKKYGTTLQGNKKGDKNKVYWLQMLQEELMDAILYTEKEIVLRLAKKKKKKKAL